MRGRGILKLYQDLLRKRPYLVQAAQTGTLMGAGDLISQMFIEKKPLDLARTLKFSSIGYFIAGPTLCRWYGVLNKYVGSSGKTVVLKKVFLDQFIFAPSFLCVFLTAVGITQGKDWDTIKKDISVNYPDILVTNYYIWPWVQLVNFNFIPLQYQVLVAQTVALFWNTYMAWKTNKRHVVDM